MSETRRVYHSTLRAEQARRTRQAVLDAAEACFVRDGYAGTTMKAIAAEAQVAVQTVFAQGGKPAILLALVDRAVVGDDTDEALIERGDVRRLMAARDKGEKLAALRPLAAAYTSSSGAMLRVFRDAAAGDAEIAGHWAEYERRRYADLHAMTASFGPLLREGLDVDRAADIAWSVITGETADHLCRGRGWTVDDYADWVVDAVDRLLLR